MGFLRTNEKEEIVNASESSGFGREVLCALQQSNDATAVWQSLGRCIGFSEATILLACLCEQPGQLGNLINGSASLGKQTNQAKLRGVFSPRYAVRSSCGWEPSKQCIRQFTDAMSVLSQQNSHINEAIGRLRSFNGFPLATEIPSRIGRLRAYGNAIVPQAAAEFIKACA
jgi:hypothetical protein